MNEAAELYARVFPVALIAQAGFTTAAAAFTRRPVPAVASGFFAALLLNLPLVWPAPAPAAGAVLAHVAAVATIGSAVHLARQRAARYLAYVVPAPLAWNGIVPLTACLVTWAGWLAAVAYTGGALHSYSMTEWPRTVSGALAAFWAAAAVAVAWLVLGTLRAAVGYGRRGGWAARSVAAAAGLAALLAALVAVAVSDEPLAQARAHAGVAFGPEERSQYRVRVLRDGRELELSGTLGFGAGEDLAAALDANPAVRILHLDSTGGRVFEGERVARLVTGRRLVTYVADECKSACVIAFGAGRERWLSPSARVGLHAPSGTGSTASELRAIARRLTEDLAARGIDRAFLERSYATPADAMWEPSHEELLAARLATRHVRFDEVALSGADEEELSRLDLSLREGVLFQALYEFERPLFDRTVAALRDGHARGRSGQEAIGFLDAEVAELLEAALPRTSDQAAVRVFRAAMALARAEADSGHPERCARLIAFGTGGELIEPGPRTRELADAIGVALAEARLAPAAVPPHANALAQLRVASRAAELAPVLAELELDDAEARSRPADYCAAMLAVTEATLELPVEMAGPLLRRWAADQDGAP